MPLVVHITLKVLTLKDFQELIDKNIEIQESITVV